MYKYKNYKNTRITDKIVNQLVIKYPKIEINKIEVDSQSRSEDDIASQIIEDIFDED